MPGHYCRVISHNNAGIAGIFRYFADDVGIGSLRELVVSSAGFRVPIGAVSGCVSGFQWDARQRQMRHSHGVAVLVQIWECESGQVFSQSAVNLSVIGAFERSPSRRFEAIAPPALRYRLPSAARRYDQETGRARKLAG